MLDSTDFEIIEILKKDGRVQWREIGENVHLTGQAVKNRIQRMEKIGVIDGYTVRLNFEKIGQQLEAYITVFMKTTDHAGFKTFLKTKSFIMEASRISGEGCYMLKVKVDNHEELVQFLDELLKWANYKVNTTIERVI